MKTLAAFVLVIWPSVAWAQTPKGFRVEAGFSDNHRGDDRSLAGAIRGCGGIDQRGLVTVEAGALIGTPFLGGDGGLDVRVPVGKRLALLARGGAGITLEDGYIGPFWRYGGGLELQVTTRNRLTITYQRGGHDERDIGLHLLMLGVERRLGRR